MTGVGDAESARGTEAFSAEPATLYVVATPIGNLRDVTLRALDILRSADVILAEDTRVTATLLARYGIATRPRALHRHNEAREVERTRADIAAGRSVALVSDAGTPAISDPGARLVRAIAADGYRVVPLPGASAVAAAVSAAGLDAESFVFIGFLPQQAKARRAMLATFAPLPAALVFYEAPHRVADTLRELGQALEGPRMLTIARELTKAFETIARMPLADAPMWLAADAESLARRVRADRRRCARTSARGGDLDRGERAARSAAHRAAAVARCARRSEAHRAAARSALRARTGDEARVACTVLKRRLRRKAHLTIGRRAPHCEMSFRRRGGERALRRAAPATRTSRRARWRLSP